jgi:putative heme-binding domain-containing protein
MVNGSGGFLGSDLSGYAGGLSVKEIHESITDPSRNLSLRSRSATVVTKDGQAFRGQVRNQDNFSLQLQSEDGTFHLFQKSDIAKLSFPAGSLMPGDYGQKLTSAEISDLISYLMQVAAGNASRQKPPGEQLGELDAH